jgi:hypothetical protein
MYSRLPAASRRSQYLVRQPDEVHSPNCRQVSHVFLAAAVISIRCFWRFVTYRLRPVVGSETHPATTDRLLVCFYLHVTASQHILKICTAWVIRPTINDYHVPALRLSKIAFFLVFSVHMGNTLHTLARAASTALAI